MMVTPLSQRQPTRLVGQLPVVHVIAFYTEGKTLESIAKIAGVSRERIRQVLAQAGYTSQTPSIMRLREDRRRNRRQAIAQRRAEKRANQRALLERQLTQWSDLWHAGLTAQQMAEQLGVSNSAITARINYYRTHETRDWFPKRQLSYDKLPAPRGFRQQWGAGKTIEHIAEHYGTSIKQVKLWLMRARRQFGLEAFPHHCQRRDEWSSQPDERQEAYLARLRKLLRPLQPGWAAGLPIEDLATSIGVPPRRLSTLIVVARSRLGWFAKRGSDEGLKLLRIRMRHDLAQAHRLWKTGLTLQKMTVRLGISFTALVRKISRARTVLGAEWFARRQLSKADYQQQLLTLSRLWKKGLSTRVICERSGIKLLALSCKIFEHRRRYGDVLFPRRRNRHPALAGRR